MLKMNVQDLLGTSLQVVTQKINDHYVLGTILAARQQVRPQARIDAGFGVTPASTFDGPRFSARTVEGEEALGRARCDLEIAIVEKG